MAVAFGPLFFFDDFRILFSNFVTRTLVNSPYLSCGFHGIYYLLQNGTVGVCVFSVHRIQRQPL